MTARTTPIGRLRSWLEGREFLRHVLVLMSGTALAQLVPILVSPILSRLYTPYEFGILTAFMSLVAMLVTIATWRYDLAIVLPKEPADARALVKVAVRLSTITCLVVGLGLVVVADPVSRALGNLGLKPWIAGVGLVAWAYAQVGIFSTWCNRQKDYRRIGSNRVLQASTTTGLQLAGGAAGLGPAGLIVSVGIGQLVAAGNLIRQTRREILGKPASPLREVMVEHRKLPLVTTPTAVLDTVRVNGTQLMISAFFSSAALGQFGQAWRLLQAPITLINSSLATVFFQRLSVTPRGKVLHLVVRMMSRTALIGVVPFGLVWLLAPPLFPVIFGEPWAQAGVIAAALVPWLYLNFVTSPISLLFVVAGRQGVLFWFGIPFTAAPLWLVAVSHSDIIATVSYLSWLMAGLLVVLIGLALWVARRYDREPETTHATEPGQALGDVPQSVL